MPDPVDKKPAGLRVDRLAEAMEAARRRSSSTTPGRPVDEMARTGGSPQQPAPTRGGESGPDQGKEAEQVVRPDAVAVSPTAVLLGERLHRQTSEGAGPDIGAGETLPPSVAEPAIEKLKSGPLFLHPALREDAGQPEADEKVAVTPPDKPRDQRRPKARLLTLAGVAADIGRYHILHDISLEVPEGEVTMLMGRNGAGKTTTLRTIMGLWRARAGSITLSGQEIAGLGPTGVARLGVGYVPEDMGIFSDLTVSENMALAVRAGRIDQARLDWILDAFPPLKTFWKSPAGVLSGGQKQMLSVARAVAEERRLYLIDEPTKGLAPVIVSALLKVLSDLKAQGATILLVEQNFAVACAIGDTAVVMEDGRTVWNGEMAELSSDRSLQERLMGLSLEAR